MSEQVKGWNIRVEAEGGNNASRAFSEKVVAHNLGRMGEKLIYAANELAIRTGGKDVCIVSSGHVRQDGTGYAALSISVSTKETTHHASVTLADTNEA